MTSGLPVPADPDRPDPFGKTGPDAGSEHVEVGDFRQGSPFSQWALARYLVGRAITESMGWALLGVGIVLLGLSALVWAGFGSALLGVLLLLLAVGVLVFRVLLLGIVRRLTAFRSYGPLEEQMKALVSDTSSDVLRELRRIDLPGRMWTLPLLALRFLGRDRRRETVERLRRFEVDRAVPKARLDELHLLVRTAFGAQPGQQFGQHPGTGPGTWQPPV